MKEKIPCPVCKLNNTVKFGFRVSRKGRRQRYRCNDCGRTFVPVAKEGSD